MHQNRINRFSLDLLLTGILLIPLALSFGGYVWAEKQIDRANDTRYLSYVLADELRQSSDDLTRMVRTYVSTGDPRFKKQYQDILAIRDGRKPRPEGYSGIYWDLVLPDGKPPRPDTTQRVPLLDLMKKSGFSAGELDLLSQAKLRSDRLVQVELEAMRMVEEGGPALELKRARAMLYGPQYHEAKAAIMEPIDRFYRLLDARTREAVQATVRQALVMRCLFLGFAGGLVFMLWRSYSSLRTTLGGSVGEVQAQIARIGQGDFASSISAEDGAARTVMGWLAQSQAKLAAADWERSRAVQALVESENRWKFAIEGSGDGVWDWNIRTDEAKYSRGWKEMLGYEERDILPRNQEWVERIHPEDRAYVAATMEAYLAGKTPLYQVEYRLRCKDGGYKWILGRGMVVDRDQEGKPQRMVGTHTDITDRKQMEEKLRLSEKKFATAFRVSPDAINLTRLKDGVYLEVNEGFYTLGGYRAEDVVGKSSLELNIWVDPADRGRLVTELEEHGVVNNLEAEFRRKDGSIFTGIMSARIIEVEGEQSLLSITRDISERKQAELYLKESEKNLRTLMDSMPAGVWWYDNEGNVEYLNRCFTELFAYTLEDVPNLSAWVLKAYPDPEYRENYLAERNAAIARAWQSGTMVPPREVRVTCKDGTQRYVIINTQPALGRMVEIFTDITEREMYLHQFQRVEKLESLGVLAGGIAHDFNNILTGIMGNVSFARSILEENHRAAPLLLSAEQAATRAADLAHQLLTFAKGGQPIKRTVSVRHILSESASFALHGSSVSADIQIPEELPDIEVDEGQISQVMNNLLINAAQAMPDGGTIVIRTRAVEVEASNPMSLSPGKYVRVEVADNGCGISEEDQKRIFDPYFTTKSGGSGLGLASVHSIVTKHGGYIEVHSTLGIGTCFELVLPASDQKVTHEVKAPVAVDFSEGNGYSILVMDDEELIRTMTSQMVASLGYHAETCRDGEEAIALYREAHEVGSPFAAVIMDLTVPGGMGGREAARRILEFDPKALLIVSSGYSTDPIMAEYEKYGFCATLMKPYTVVEIMNTLREVLAG